MLYHLYYSGDFFDCYFQLCSIVDELPFTLSYFPEKSLESIKTRMASEVYRVRIEKEIREISQTISKEEA